MSSESDLSGRTVYHVTHAHPSAHCEDEDEVKHIGIYSTREKAEDVVSRLKSQPGFVDTPEGFSIDAATIDLTGWSEGYITLGPETTPDNMAEPGGHD